MIYIKIFILLSIIIFGLLVSFLLVSSKESFENEDNSKFKTDKSLHNYPFFSPDRIVPREDPEPNTQSDIEFRKYCRDFPSDIKCRQNLGISDFEYSNEIDGKKFSPPADGQDKNLRAMSMFSYNKCDPKCKDYGYTCPSGNYCLTKKQLCFLNKNGYNKA